MAGAIELATAYIALVPSLKGASQGISSQLTPASAVAGAEGSASLGSALVGGLSKFAAPIAGIVAAFSVGKLVKDSIKDFQEYQGAVNGFGRIAGGTTKEYSGLREAIKLSGVDVDAAQGGLTIFSKNLGNASQDGAKASAMAKKLGTDFLDAHGQVKPMSDILPGLSDKFKAMPDGAEKTALAMQLFGRSGTQMLPFLNQGSEGIAKLTAQAGKMGLILDDTDKKIFAASKAGVREYTESVKGLHVAIGSTLLPVFTAFGNVGRSITIPMVQALSGAIQSARGPMMAMAGHVQAFADRTRAAMEGILTLFTKGNFTGGLGKALGIEEDSKIVGAILNVRDAVTGFFSGFKHGVDELGSNQSAFAHWGAAIYGVFATAKTVVQVFFDGLKTGSNDAGGRFIGTVGSIGNIVNNAFGIAKAAVQTFFDGLKTGSNDAGGGFIGAMGNIGNTLHSLWEAIGPLLPQILGLVTSFSPLHIVFSAIAPVLPQISAAFGQLASAIGSSLGSALTTIVPVLSQLAQTLVSTLGQAVTQILPSIVSLVPLVATSFAQLLPVIAGLITQLAPLVASLLPPLVGLFTSLIPVVVQLVTSVLPVAVQIITMLVQAIVPLVTILAQMLIPIIQALMPVVIMVFGVIASVITSVMQIVQGIIQVVLGVISGNWGMVWDGILNIFSGIWNTIVSVVSGVMSIIGSVIMAGLSIVGSVVSAALEAIGGFFSDTFNNTITNVSSFIGTLLNFFGGLPNQIMGALGNIGGWLVDSGRALIQGFIDGIKGMVGSIGDAVGGVLDFAKSFFPHSPAKRGPFSGSGYTTFSGQALANDFAKGIASQNDVVADAAAGIMTSASLTGRVGISGALLTGSRGRGAGVTNNWTINQVDDPIGTSHAIARRQNAMAV